MKRKTLIGIVSFAVLAALVFAACHHRSAEGRIGWLVDEISDRLSLDTVQRERLDAMTQDFLARKKAMAADREAVREAVMNELRKPHLDRSVIEGLVADKRRKMDEMVAFLIDSAVSFHDMLTPEQQETLVRELEKYHARAEKYGHHRW